MKCGLVKREHLASPRAKTMAATTRQEQKIRIMEK